MLVDILRIIFIAGGLAFVFMLVQACWQKKCNGTLEATPFWPAGLPTSSIPWGWAALR